MLLFRIVCLLQMLITVFLSFTSLIYFGRTGYPYFFMEAVFFILMASLAILGLSLLSSNYPDRPVRGKQKTVFNWLYLLNFLLLAFLFGLVFASINEVNMVATVLGKSVFLLPLQLLTPLIVNITILVFQFFILYGLYALRRQLFLNASARQFDFEKENTRTNI